MDDSPLPRLPAELRNRIYELVLVEGTVEVFRHIRKIWKSPALLHTSRQIRAEASSIYFGGNSFLITGFLHHDRYLSSWLRVLPAPSRAAIQRVYSEDRVRHADEVALRIEALRRLVQAEGVGLERVEWFVRQALGPDEYRDGSRTTWKWVTV